MWYQLLAFRRPCLSLTPNATKRPAQAAGGEKNRFSTSPRWCERSAQTCRACGTSSNKNRRAFGPRGAPSRGRQHRCPRSRRATSSSAAVKGKARMHTSFGPCILQTGPRAMWVSFCYLRNLRLLQEGPRTLRPSTSGVENERGLRLRTPCQRGCVCGGARDACGTRQYATGPGRGAARPQPLAAAASRTAASLSCL